MDSNSPLIEHYRAVVSAARGMLEYARADQWSEVASIARTISGLTNALDEYKSRSAPLGREQDRERIRLLAELVRIDAQVSQLRQPWVGRLDEMLGSAQQRSLFSGHGPNRTQP